MAGIVFKTKGALSGNNDYWLRGQLCMFQPQYLAAPSNAQRGDIHRRHARTSSFVTHHMAFLTSPSGEAHSVLELDGQEIKYGGDRWLPACHYPQVENESILFLCLMGTANYPAFSRNGIRLTVRGAFDRYILQVNDIDVKNPDAFKNDGDWLEALGFTAMCVASHERGVGGVDLRSFVQCLCAELSPGQDWIERTIDPSMWSGLVPPGCLNFLVPFLFPSSCAPPHLTAVEGTRFGTLVRPPDGEKKDFKVLLADEKVSMTGESKNHQALKLKTLKEVLQRVPDTSLVHIVICDTLQNQYFASKADSGFTKFAQTCPTVASSALLRVSAANDKLLLAPLNVNRPAVSVSSCKRVVLFISLQDLSGSEDDGAGGGR
jgi:hypothetical protein